MRYPVLLISLAKRVFQKLVVVSENHVFPFKTICVYLHYIKFQTFVKTIIKPQFFPWMHRLCWEGTWVTAGRSAWSKAWPQSTRCVTTGGTTCLRSTQRASSRCVWTTWSRLTGSQTTAISQLHTPAVPCISAACQVRRQFRSRLKKL